MKTTFDWSALALAILLSVIAGLGDLGAFRMKHGFLRIAIVALVTCIFVAAAWSALGFLFPNVCSLLYLAPVPFKLGVTAATFWIAAFAQLVCESFAIAPLRSWKTVLFVQGATATVVVGALFVLYSIPIGPP